MQGKIFDFASDKIVKSLQKIDKNDVKKVMMTFSGKPQNKSDKSLQPSVKFDGTSGGGSSGGGVSSSEEYCKMVKNEFSFTPTDGEKELLMTKNSSSDKHKDNHHPANLGN